MAKILLVEDDQNLREIYSIRLTAEGYEIVTAADGEEALAVAAKERPDLVLSDVMMPKISGFDMLDILRTTPETKDIKVIMMTALSSEDQRKRGESLGADRYLVKSQVGIEDVVNAVHEVMSDLTTPVPVDVTTDESGQATTPGVPEQPAEAQPAAPAQAPAPQPVAAQGTPQPVSPQPAATPQTAIPQPAQAAQPTQPLPPQTPAS